MAAKCAELMLSLFERLAAALGEFASTHLFDCEILILQDVINRLERVLAGNPGRPGVLPPPAGKNAVPRSEEERRREYRPRSKYHEGTRGQIASDERKEGARSSGNHSKDR